MLHKVAVGLCTLICATSLVAQTADEIVTKNIEAHGGAAKLKSINTMKSSGTMMMGPGIEVPFTEYQKRPALIRQEFTFQGMTAVQASDGKDAWGIMPFQGKKDPEALPGEQRDELLEDAEIGGLLLDYAKKGTIVESLGKDKLEGTDVYKLKATLKDGAIYTYYIDTDSGLEVRIDTKRTVRGSEQNHTIVMGDYQQFNGVAIPMSLEASDSDHPDQKQKITMKKVEFDTPMEASLFSMPAPTSTTTKGADTAEPKPAAPDTKKPDETPKTETPKR